MLNWLKKLLFGVQPLGINQTSWLKALESDKYKQGRGLLCSFLNGNGGAEFCCLGVACDNFATHFVEEKGVVHYLGEAAKAPYVITTILALYSKYGDTKDHKGPSLVSLNDEKRLSFKEIAAIIRKDPSVYFSEPR